MPCFSISTADSSVLILLFLCLNCNILCLLDVPLLPLGLLIPQFQTNQVFLSIILLSCLWKLIMFFFLIKAFLRSYKVGLCHVNISLCVFLIFYISTFVLSSRSWNPFFSCWNKLHFFFRPSTSFFFFLWDWVWTNSGLHTYKANAHKAGALLLKSHLQSILLQLFWT
jgi:hypothetical protein